MRKISSFDFLKKTDARCKLDRVKKGCRSVVSISIGAGVSRLQIGQITVHSKIGVCCWLTHTSAGGGCFVGVPAGVSCGVT